MAFSISADPKAITGKSLRDIMEKADGNFDGLLKSVGLRGGLDSLDDAVTNKVRVKADGTVRFADEAMSARHVEMTSMLKKIESGKALTDVESTALRRNMGRQRTAMTKLATEVEKLEAAVAKVAGKPEAELDKFSNKVEEIFNIAESAENKTWAELQAEVKAKGGADLANLGFEVKTTKVAGKDVEALVFKAHGGTDIVVAHVGDKGAAVLSESGHSAAVGKFEGWVDKARDRTAKYVEKLQEQIGDIEGGLKETESMMAKLEEKGVKPIIEKAEAALAKAGAKEANAAEGAVEKAAGKSKLLPGLMTAAGVGLTLHGLSDEENKFNLRTIGGVVLTAVGLGGLMKGRAAQNMMAQLPNAASHSVHL